MELSLSEINKKLIETDEQLATALTKLFPLEMAYTTRYNKLMLNSGMSNQTAREAEALEVVKLEPIYEEYLEQKLQVKILYSRKDVLTEVSRNMRNLAFNES
jgi:hypothetical protein